MEKVIIYSFAWDAQSYFAFLWMWSYFQLTRQEIVKIIFLFLTVQTVIKIPL